MIRVANEKNWKLYQGNMLDMAEVIEPNSIDSIITDPPYELNFMGKGWDNSGIAFQKETWERCYKVLKSGGYLLAFGGSRTYHRIACAIEDAGFEIRDTIMWLYGCLSEDTEILTQKGFKKYSEIKQEEEIRIYDIENGVFKWEKPERWQVYSVNKDTCYRIKSDSTDQLVSRNHRCLVERNGVLVFEYAENLDQMERVPILSYDIPFIQESGRVILFEDLLWQGERLDKEIFSEWEGQEESEKIPLWRKEPILGKWGDLSAEERELYKSKYQICEVSERVYNDGEKRRLCDGTSTNSGEANRQTFIENGSSASHKSQCRGQQHKQFDVVPKQSRSQELRERKSYQTTLATVTEEEYTGIIYCPTVSTGCFVARRNGKVFITGNSGFPKSMNIGLAIDKKNGVESKVVGSSDFPNIKGGNYENNNGDRIVINKCEALNEWNGWGTALKPSYEPIIIARKPCEGSCTDNVLKYGVGGINIDECRISISDNDFNEIYAKSSKNPTDNYNSNPTRKYGKYKLNIAAQPNVNGRFPANTILTYDETDFDEVCGGMPDTKGSAAKRSRTENDIYGKTSGGILQNDVWGDSGSAARYFYCAKASKRDRDEGLDGFKERQKVFNGKSNKSSKDIKDVEQRFTTTLKNIHPTVKPTALMQYLVRLVTPKGGTVLDPFNGSGSTGKAVMYENKDRDAGYKYIGIELTEEYIPIAIARINYVCDSIEETESEETKQMTIFDFI